MSKSTTAENTSAFAVLVKVSPKIKSFDFWTTNMMKFSQKKVYLRATFTKVSRATNRGGMPFPPQGMKCQNKEINAGLRMKFFPLVKYFYLRRKKFGKFVLVFWNIYFLFGRKTFHSFWKKNETVPTVKNREIDCPWSQKFKKLVFSLRREKSI